MHEVQTVVEFTITSFATSDEAAGVRMDEAVDQGKAAVDHMKPAPFNTEGEVINAISDINTITEAWDPLLERIKLCTKIVDAISEV